MSTYSNDDEEPEEISGFPTSTWTLDNYVDFFFNNSVLLTPPESIRPEDSPGSPGYCDSIFSDLRSSRVNVSDGSTGTGLENDRESDWEDCDDDEDHQVDQDELEAEVKASLANTSDVQFELSKCQQQLIVSAVDSFEREKLDFTLRITKCEWIIMNRLAKLKKSLTKLERLQEKLFDEEVQRIASNVSVPRDEGNAAEVLVHIGKTQPVVKSGPLPVKFPHCRTIYRRELTSAEQFKFKAAILTAVVQPKLLNTASRLDGLLSSAGLSSEQLQRLSYSKYDPLVMKLITEAACRATVWPFRTVAPVVHTWYADGKMVANARTLMTVPDLFRWKVETDKSIKRTTLSDVYANKEAAIDWMHVSKIMTCDVGYSMEPQECEQLWNSVLNPSNEGFQWTKRALSALQRLVCDFGEQNWSQVAKRIGHGISEFMCYTMYTNYIQTDVSKVPACIQNWNADEMQIVANEINGGGNYKSATSALNKYFPTQNYKKVATKFCFRSTLKYMKRSFRVDLPSPMEDAVLLVTMEKLYDLVNYPEIPSEDLLPVNNILVWRKGPEWTHRLRLLFDECELRWTVQDELKLLYLATEFNCGWPTVAKEFNGSYGRYRSQYRLRIHYSMLTEVLASRSYLEYRRVYEDQKKKIIQCLQLRKARAELCRLMEEEYCPGNSPDFRGLSKYYPPTDSDLGDYLLTECLAWIPRTIYRIDQFLNDTDEDSDLTALLRRPGCDRRTFHREDPRSMASALHFRRLTTKPLENNVQLNKFEKLVVFHLDNFEKNTSVKRRNKRNSIPTTDELRSFPELCRILKRPTASKIPEIQTEVVLKVAETLTLAVKDQALSSVNQCLEDSHVIANQSDRAAAQITETSPSVPSLRGSKGKKVSRIREIRRLSAQRRWQKQKQEKSTDTTVLEEIVKNKQKMNPLLIQLPCALNRKSNYFDVECPCPPPTLPGSPLKENKRFADSLASSSPKRPRRETKVPTRLGF